ncbi:MAG: outer membrane protein assembly factor BamD [Acidobacteriota bacterium]
MLSRACWCLLLSALLLGGCSGAGKRPPLSPAEQYRKAEALLAARKYAKAITAYEKVDTSQDRELRALVHLRIADAYFARPNILNLAEAQSRYQSFLNFFPLSDQAPYAQFRFASCLKLQVNKPERDQAPTYRAIGEFRKVQQLYPSSSWIDEAAKQISQLEDQLSTDALFKARFYFKRKSYVASAARLKRILASNPDYPGRAEVLYLLGASLLKTGREEDGRKFLDRLDEEFPDSKFAKKARERFKG